MREVGLSELLPLSDPKKIGKLASGLLKNNIL